MKRWVVLPDTMQVVEDVVAAMGEDNRALEEGRVFIGRIRATRGATVWAGDVVDVFSKTGESARIEIAYEEAGIVVVYKPAGIPTIADHRGRENTLLALTAKEIGLPESSLHSTSRLDRDVSGVVIFATTDHAREHLAGIREAGNYSRLYVALTTATTLPDEGAWNAKIGRGRDPRLRMANGKDAIDAKTWFRVLSRSTHGALLAITPVTGRTHQIRVHASNAGAPLLGDKSYGGTMRLVSESGAVLSMTRIALHCARVSITHPETLTPLRFEAPITEDLRSAWRGLRGSDEAWNGYLTTFQMIPSSRAE